MTEKSQDERRQYQRITKHFILTYFDVADPDVKYSASQLKNVSLGGVCLITAQSFPSATRLGIALKTPFLSELTHLEGTVLESHERIKNVIYETRLEFDEISPQSKEVIEELIKHFEKERSRNE